MFHSIKLIQLLAKTFLFSMGLTLVACGGGDPDPTTAGGSNSAGILIYTGKTSPAAVDDTNTQTFSAAILDGSQDSQENLSQLSLGVSIDSNSIHQNKQHVMMSTLVEAIKSDIKNNSTGDSLVSGAIPASAGNCGGTSTVTGSNSTSGFNYTINYSNYCNSLSGISVTLSGTVAVTGTYYTSTSTLKSMNMTFSRFTMTFSDSNTSTTYTNEFSGAITANFTATGELDNMAVSVNFIENGKVYKIADMSYTTSGADVSISGTLYHPDYGYVTFETDPTDPFIVFNDQLCGGTLNVTGTNSNFTITADATCSSYTYTGTDNSNTLFGDTIANL